MGSSNCACKVLRNYLLRKALLDLGGRGHKILPSFQNGAIIHRHFSLSFSLLNTHFIISYTEYIAQYLDFISELPYWFVTNANFAFLNFYLCKTEQSLLDQICSVSNRGNTNRVTRT